MPFCEMAPALSGNSVQNSCRSGGRRGRVTFGTTTRESSRELNFNPQSLANITSGVTYTALKKEKKKGGWVKGEGEAPPCQIGCYDCQFLSHPTSGRRTATALQFQVVRGRRKH